MARRTHQFVTVDEMAAALGISANHAYRLIGQRRLPGAPVAGVIRVPRRAWEAWLQRQAESALAGCEHAERGTHQ